MRTYEQTVICAPLPFAAPLMASWFMDHEQLPVGPAIDVGATRRAVSRMALRWRLLAAAAALVVTMGAWTWATRPGPIRGREISGTVAAVEQRQSGRYPARTGVVTVTYRVLGIDHRAQITIGDNIRNYRSGQDVALEVDERTPDRVAIAGEASLGGSGPPALYFGVGAYGAIAAALGLRKVATARHVTADYPWIAVPSRIIEIPTVGTWRQRAHRILELRDPSGTVTTERVGVGAMMPTLAPTAWAAGLGRSRFVVAPPGGAPVIVVRSARLRR